MGELNSRLETTGKKQNGEIVLGGHRMPAIKYPLPPAHREEQAGGLLVGFVCRVGKGEVRMGKLPLIAAVASAMWAFPASAED